MCIHNSSLIIIEYRLAFKNKPMFIKMHFIYASRFIEYLIGKYMHRYKGFIKNDIIILKI